jgi:hypothetical protein
MERKVTKDNKGQILLYKHVILMKAKGMVFQKACFDKQHEPAWK